MDELKMTLHTKFMRNIVTKLLTKIIRNKTGYDVKVQLNNVEVESYAGKTYIRMDVAAELNNEDLVKILKSGDLI